MMSQNIIETYKNVVVQIATPYSTGTGYYLKDHNIVITNNHVESGNRKVILEGKLFEKQLAKVIFLDPKFDIAFIKPENIGDELPDIELGFDYKLSAGEKVIAVGHPFGLKFTATQGIVSNANHFQNDIEYIQHDAALNPGNSGGPLIDDKGKVVGLNTFIIKNGNSIGFSLPSYYLKGIIDDFFSEDHETGVACASCSNIVYKNQADGKYCNHCGAKIEMIEDIEEYTPIGVAKTIENIISFSGHDVELSRKGPNNWDIKEGSADISLAYHPDNGLIVGDALLSLLPKDNIKDLYKYILKENYKTKGITFSLARNAIVLSMIMYSQYLNEDVAKELFVRFIKKADYFDNILIDNFGAKEKVKP